MSGNTTDYKVEPREPLNTLFRAGDRLQSARAIVIAACHYTDELDQEYARKKFDQLLTMACEELKGSEADFLDFHGKAREMGFKNDFNLFGKAEDSFMNVSAMCDLLGAAELNELNAPGATNVFLTLVDIAHENYTRHMASAVDTDEARAKDESLIN